MEEGSKLPIFARIPGAPTWIQVIAKSGDGTLRRLLRVKLDQTDCSLYLWPYTLSNRFYFGRDQFEQEERAKTFPFKGQLESEEAPHVSLHESGQVNVRINRQTSTSAMGSPLRALRGDLIATVRIDKFGALPPR